MTPSATLSSSGSSMSMAMTPSRHNNHVQLPVSCSVRMSTFDVDHVTHSDR